MTTHLEREARTGIQVGSFPATKTQTRRIVLGAALAIVVGMAAIVMTVGTSSEPATAIPAIQVRELAPVANWAAPETNAAGLEYSPANPYVQSPSLVATTRVGQEGPR